MDFPGGNITNIRVIVSDYVEFSLIIFNNISQDGFSSIYWRIYTEEPGITNHPSEAPNNGHTILKHLSRLKDLELRLRNLDCLASCYPRRLGLWVFSATPNFDNLAPLCLNEGKDEPNRLLVGSTSLKGLLTISIHESCRVYLILIILSFGVWKRYLEGASKEPFSRPPGLRCKSSGATKTCLLYTSDAADEEFAV